MPTLGVNGPSCLFHSGKIICKDRDKFHKLGAVKKRCDSLKDRLRLKVLFLPFWRSFLQPKSYTTREWCPTLLRRMKRATDLKCTFPCQQWWKKVASHKELCSGNSRWQVSNRRGYQGCTEGGLGVHIVLLSIKRNQWTWVWGRRGPNPLLYPLHPLVPYTLMGYDISFHTAAHPSHPVFLSVLFCC